MRIEECLKDFLVRRQWDAGQYRFLVLWRTCAFVHAQLDVQEMGQLMRQTSRVIRRANAVPTAQLVILAAVTATVLAGYAVCSVMLLTTYRAQAEPYADDHGVVNSDSLFWQGRALKGNRRLLMSISSPRHKLQQQQAQQTAAQRTQQQWAQFWASDLPQGESTRRCCRQWLLSSVYTPPWMHMGPWRMIKSRCGSLHWRY